MIVPERQREFAVEIVRRLRASGFEAYWAGGCVRDQLLGRQPKDYDVATDAIPETIRDLFGRRQTLALGAAFGVMVVRGPGGAGQVEVATFRRDEGYSDGRRPDRVRFSNAREDAQRRDFTINGLFYDPITGSVIDYVGGQADLDAGLVRAIGRAQERFQEDKLRLLRAVRFAARFQFSIEAATWDAVRQMAPQIQVVSAERIAEEMRRILVDPHRARGIRLFLDSGLASTVLPEVVPRDPPGQRHFEQTLAALQRLQGPGFPLALATLLQASATPECIEAIGKRWRLSNRETERTAWLVAHRDALAGAAHRPWSSVQPLLVAEGSDELVAMLQAIGEAHGSDLSDVAWCRAALSRPREELNPPPLITGDDLLQLGMRAGPAVRPILERLRAAQLDREVQTKEEALQQARTLVQQRS